MESSFAFNTPSSVVICSKVACTDVSMASRVSISLYADTTLFILAHSAFNMQARASSSWAMEVAILKITGQGQLLGHVDGQ